MTAATTIEGASFAPGSCIFERDSTLATGWTYRTLDASTALPGADVTAPTAGTLTATSSVDHADLHVDGALDETALDPSPFSFRISGDAGATWGEWTPWQASSTFSFTGLTPSTAYRVQHRVRDAAGNVKDGAAVDTTTSAGGMVWTEAASWDFDVPDGTAINGLAPSTGAATLTAYTSDSSVTPPLSFAVEAGRVKQRADGGGYPYALAKASATDGVGIECDVALASTAGARLLVQTNSDGNVIGFEVSSLGVVTAFHSAQGATTYTAEPGAPTSVPKTCHLRAEFSKNADGSCTGKLFADGTLYGSVLSSGWTWYGKVAQFHLASNQVDSYFDNLALLSGSA